MPIAIPKLYCIVDAGCFAAKASATSEISNFTRELVSAGATLIQYRNKTDNVRDMVSHAREMVRVAEALDRRHDVKLMFNDRADLCLIAGFDGVHVGQEDISPDAARRVVGNRLWVGVSTHNVEQLKVADQSPADYVAVGPVYTTKTKQNPDPVVGLDGVRRARELTKKPLVAIGGITRQNCRAVIEAGADSVAIVSDLLHEPRRAIDEFLSLLK